MKEQSADMYKALSDMKKELEEQKQLLSEREAQIEKFTLSQFQRDAALDSFIFDTSLERVLRNLACVLHIWNFPFEVMAIPTLC